MSKPLSEKTESGGVEVEAVFILPITVLSIMALVYLSLFLYQRAALQSALETTLVYYKAALTDNFVSYGSKVDYSTNDSETVGSTNTYNASKALNPYSGMFGDKNRINDQDTFELFFDSTAVGMIFKDNLEVSVNYENGIVTDHIEAIAVQKLKFPFDISLLGTRPEVSLSATARIAALDNDSLIRDADYVVDLVTDLGLRKYVDDIVGKITGVYDKIKNKLGV